jgi:hypothetical protein
MEGETICAAENKPTSATRQKEVPGLTLIWFVVWLVADLIGDRESLTFYPVNGWAATLILAAALDLGRQHAPELGGRRGQRSGEA